MLYSDKMPARIGFFTKALSQILDTLELMASPEGTTIAELSKSLSLTRRSVFRIIKAIEQDLHIPIIIDRKEFGGVATYRIPQGLIEKLSPITTPHLILSFRQAILFYLLFKDDISRTKQ